MALSSIIIQLLCLGAVNSAIIKRLPSGVSPTGPIDPNVAANCDYWVNDIAKTDKCSDLEEYFNISQEELMHWNPSLKEGCHLQAGHSYCVAAPAMMPGSGILEPKADPTHTDAPSPPEAAEKPSPTQGGLAGNCNAFYKVQKGDSCWSIVNNYGNFTLEQFYSWNPAIGKSCERLYPEYYVCIGVEKKKPEPAPTQPPMPEQSGIPEDCNKFHKVSQGDSCWTIANQYGLSLEQFYDWNPALKPSCRSLLPDYYVCVGVADRPAPKLTAKPL